MQLVKIKPFYPDCENIPVWSLGHIFCLSNTTKISELREVIDNYEDGQLFIIDNKLIILIRLNLWKTEIKDKLKTHVFDFKNELSDECINFAFWHKCSLTEESGDYKKKCDAFGKKYPEIYKKYFELIG